MLAKEMSDTRNRGQIIWVFATSAPTCSRSTSSAQGRLDVHIPLFPPGDAQGAARCSRRWPARSEWTSSPRSSPSCRPTTRSAATRWRGSWSSALRIYETQPPEQAKRPSPELISEAIADFRPSAHTERLEYMDLVAVKECTDARFLPERFHDLSLPDVNQRISRLKLAIGE